MKTLKPPPEKSRSRGCLTVFAIVWLAGSCLPIPFMAIPIIGIVVSGEGDPAAMALTLLGTLVFTVPFFLVGLGLLVWSLWPVIVGVKFTPPEVSVSSDAVRPGDTLSFRFHQTFKSAVEVKQASLQLLLRETAIYRRGTNTYTVTHDFVIQRFDLPPRSYQAGEMLSDQREWQIPAEAMHTFASTHNRLRWLIVVQVGMSGWPDFKEEYEVRVLPERM
jgi:hypothetical protein